MSSDVPISQVALAVSAIGLAGCDAAPPAEAGRGAGIRPVFSQALPHMNGDHLKTIGVEVSYAPGASSVPHSHPCAVTGYVLQGAIRTQVRGEPEAVYQAGQSFYEPPNGVHQVSANASGTEPARLLAVFTCDSDAPLTVPVADSGQTGPR
jgi:quercetin dioxygenase-like cupin family protein